MIPELGNTILEGLLMLANLFLPISWIPFMLHSFVPPVVKLCHAFSLCLNCVWLPSNRENKASISVIIHGTFLLKSDGHDFLILVMLAGIISNNRQIFVLLTHNIHCVLIGIFYWIFFFLTICHVT